MSVSEFFIEIEKRCVPRALQSNTTLALTDSAIRRLGGASMNLRHGTINLSVLHIGSNGQRAAKRDKGTE